ncbi:Saposin B type, region 2 [Dillenia turbinata]|uniref:Pulmonary surfactant-associated protein B n=1 Tax=Dillenia turbinata TaxID=194707 RepID=A0AAN8ZMH4_9MAGN
MKEGSSATRQRVGLPNPQLRKFTLFKLSLCIPFPRKKQRMMDKRVEVLILYVLAACWASAARQVTLDPSRQETVLGTVKQINYQEPAKVQALKEVGGNETVCTLCEQFVNQTLTYLAENQTQTDLINVLHNSCAALVAFKQECITLVDYYIPLFFSQISSIEPETFCQKVNLCELMASASSSIKQDSCGLCHRAVNEAIEKLKDPDTQLEIIKVLLKGCDAMESHVKKCKKLVVAYGPMILANTEQFLKSTDICATLHACEKSFASGKQTSPDRKL